jgi:hypothetical protein
MSQIWVVTLSGTRPIMSVAEDAEQAGLLIRHVLPEIGVILGEGNENIASTMRTVEGVSDISLDLPIGVNLPATNDG